MKQFFNCLNVGKMLEINEMFSYAIVEHLCFIVVHLSCYLNDDDA